MGGSIMGIRHPRNGWRALWRDQSGATALITGLALLLIACAAMTVFDLGNVSSQKSKLQDMLDAAALAAAKVGGDDEDAIVKAGDEHLKAHLPADVYKNLVVTFTPTENTVRATATAGVDPYFVGMFVDGPIGIAVDSEVTRSVDGSLEVVLVLDTTGSMAGTKIATLKTAADGLVKKITKVKDADVKIGVVPFSNYVNVGVKRRNESWVSVADDYDVKVEGKCTKITQETKCKKSQSYACTKYNDGVPYQSTCSKCIETETTYFDPPKENCSKDSVSKYRFRGCVGSPAYPQNVQDSNPPGGYPGLLNVSCASEITPLTDKLGPVESAIKSLKAEYETYIPAGLAWGWNLLSPAAPFTEAGAYDPANKKPRKALVLMTDGANTMQPNANGRHVSKTPAPQADQYTAELCENIKKQKIEIYTVGFQIDDAAAHEMLLKCATSSGHYFKADSSEALIKAFEAIGASLENLRISH
jgi:Flp pilus assembly protein TadG